MSGFVTQAVHGVTPAPAGPLRPPVHDSVSFGQQSAAAAADAFAGRRPAHLYSRISNPTVEELEKRLTLLAGGRGCIALASGMAAISNVVLALAGSGTSIVTTRHLFGNTISLLERTLAPWGLTVRYVDLDDDRAVAGAIDETTRLIFFESVTNPQLEMVAVPKLAAVAHRHGIPLVCDNTVLTPYLFCSRKFGVDVEILSTTKYISGGATSVGGAIIDNGLFDWRLAPRMARWAAKLGPFALLGALRREVFRNLGACMAPHHAYLQTLGLESLALRIDQSCANALRLARFLENQPQVAAVHYPGLADSPCHETARQQCERGFGGILTFDLASREECFRFQDSLQIIRRATNINDNKSLILHPASTIFCEYSKEQRQQMDVRDTMLRLSVGIEAPEDLEADLAGALAALERDQPLTAVG